METLMLISKNKKLINLVICKNQILTLAPFKKRLIILVIQEKFFVISSLKRRLVFYRILTSILIKIIVIKPNSVVK